MATAVSSKEKHTSTSLIKTPFSSSKKSGRAQLADNGPSGSSAVENEEGLFQSTGNVEPTDWEMANLRRVGESIPPAVFLVAIAEMAERFIYRCMTGPLRTY